MSKRQDIFAAFKAGLSAQETADLVPDTTMDYIYRVRCDYAKKLGTKPKVTSAKNTQILQTRYRYLNPVIIAEETGCSIQYVYRVQSTILTAAALFAGAGGICLGFKEAGIQTIFASDINKDACSTYRLHSPDTIVVQRDIALIETDEIPNCDILTGAFPCQSFSVAGKRNVQDPRGSLYKHFVRIVRAKQVKCFISENVKGLLSMGGGEVLNQIIKDFESAGYNVFYELLNAKDYGVPQHRERIIIVGFRRDLGIKDFKIPPYRGKTVTIGDVLKDLSAPLPEDICDDTYSPWYMRRNRRRGFNEVSHTILATSKQIPIYSGSPTLVRISKEKWIFGTSSPTRRFSWQEAAAVQSFPPNIEFVGSLVSKYRQVGNAVPPALARHIGEAVKEVLIKK